ncbi:MAG: S8 family serine peptidase, partial [Lachnospiraceae bacterium]|nr:S8 family serine peptidase [Lachnospiraceae bacterium]
MRARKKLSKRMLTILLSAIMVVEPVSGSIPVRAAEPDAGQIMIEEVTEDTEGTDDKEETPENSDSTEEGEKGDTSGDQESGDTGSDDQNKEKEPDDQDNQGEDDSDQKETDEGNPDEKDPEEENVVEDQETEEDQDVSISGNDIDEAEEDDLGKFSSMPSDYRLTAEQRQMKQALSASMEEFDESQEGETYIERQVFAFADTSKEAEAIAEAYHAELIEYDEDVAVLKLTEGTSVGEALNVAADLDNNLPAVYPDYYRYAHEEEIPQDNSSLMVVEEEYELEGTSSEEILFEESLSDEPTLETYEQTVEALGDPYMSYNSDYYQWQHVNVGSVYAWNAGYKGNGVTVAVLDTGVSAGAEVTVKKNINKASKASSADDKDGHGTHVAGVIAAQINDKVGAGIAPKATIVNVKVLGDDGSGSDSDIIQGIIAAQDAGVDIMNLSLGGIGYNPAVEQVVNEAYTAGIAIFVSAGNDGGNNMCYPAALNNVICVGAIDNNNQRASFSNYGSWVDLSAPGVDIWSIAPGGNSPACMSGTSQACPVAAGEAAVILSAELESITKESGKKKVDALKKVMQQNTVSAGSGMGKGVTSLTKVFKLTTAAAKPNAPTISARDVSTDTNRILEIAIKAQEESRIYYTTNGKNPVFKNGAPGAGTEYAPSEATGTPA